MYSLTKAIKTR